MSTNSLTARNIASTFGVNLIYAKSLFQFLDKDSTLEDVQKLINEKPKPFVEWVGGKRQLLKQFRDTFIKLYKKDCIVTPSNSDAPLINTFYSGHKRITENIKRMFEPKYNYATSF